MDKNTTREQLEARDNFIATFEIAAKPGHYRCLLETPAGQLFWHDVGKEKGWRWGICECYEGDDALKTLTTAQYYNLVKGVLPWGRKSKAKKVDESKIEAEANRILGIEEAGMGSYQGQPASFGSPAKPPSEKTPAIRCPECEKAFSTGRGPSQMRDGEGVRCPHCNAKFRYHPFRVWDLSKHE